jgi:hypothetical protein
MDLERYRKRPALTLLLALVFAGEMQKHYVHSVPCDNHSVGGEDPAAEKRIAIVFRRGRAEEQTIDSGKTCASLAPHIRQPYHFGNCIQGLHEGSTYTRIQLVDLLAHR